MASKKSGKSEKPKESPSDDTSSELPPEPAVDAPSRNTAIRRGKYLLSIEPKFTSERWRDGIISTKDYSLSPSLYMHDFESLNADQKYMGVFNQYWAVFQDEYEEAEVQAFRRESKELEDKYKRMIEDEVMKRLEKKPIPKTKPEVPKSRTADRRTSRSISSSESDSGVSKRKQPSRAKR
ncbi:hypothetical protein CEXT_546601 [Caerostris extrusa]|uniref:Uncharacterized protein n=1 Tax=Caerostris extrusa TaxID=172846 RepID=A0AAV4XYS5_CAEEX|nr:hypothetical protein CEXT_546601 [Caerostris extrusa]